MIRAFIEAEFFKLRHLRITKITILAMLLTPIVTIGILWRLETAYTVFPGAMELFGDSLLMVGLISLLLLAAAVGNEYEQGTVRMIISRGTPRWLFVAGKGAALLGIGFLNALALWFSVGVMAILGHLNHVGSGVALQLGIVSLFTSGLDTVAIATLAAAAYIGVGLVIGVLTRSSSFTMLVGIGLVAADFYLVNIQDKSHVFSNLSILGNSNFLVSQLYFQMKSGSIGKSELETEPTTAVLILLTYAIGGVLLAILLFQRQELED